MNKVIFISYNKEIGFNINILLETKKGIIPYTIEKTDKINNYPYLAKKIMEGNILYVDYSGGYVGIKKTEGPYCEQDVFISEYESNNIGFDELLMSLNKEIKDNNIKQRKLVKIGEHYK